jgi:hypothetical protein
LAHHKKYLIPFFCTFLLTIDRFVSNEKNFVPSLSTSYV